MVRSDISDMTRMVTSLLAMLGWLGPANSGGSDRRAATWYTKGPGSAGSGE